MKPKHQRLLLAVVAVAALVGAGLIAASALREEASYFYTPTTLASANLSPLTRLQVAYNFLWSVW